MPEGSCIFEGRFGDIQIPDVLTFLDMLGKTGTLEVERRGQTRRLFWDSGEIVFADSTLPEESLPGWLVRNGSVSPEAVEVAQGEASGEEDLVGQLIQMGEMEPRVLPRALRGLVLDIVYGLFEWDEGEFRFLVTELPHAERVVLRTSVSNIIMEGSRRLDEWRRIRAVFPHDEVFPYPAEGDSPASVKLAPVEEETLGHVDGKRTVAEIVRLVQRGHFTCLSALHALLTTGFIAVSDQPRAAPPSALGGAGLSPEEERTARAIVNVFNNIFAGIHERVLSVKGDAGRERFTATLAKPTFQKAGLFQGLSFQPDGRLPADPLLGNVAALASEQRLQRLKGTMDRLLAQQVLQMDNSYPREDKNAISELISREKERLPSGL